VATLKVDASATGQDQHLVRPPGATPDFLQRCIRCSQCVKVCPTGALQPAGLQSGWEGLWSPVLVARLGYCDWNCNACGQVCPTGAIQPLELAQKRQTVIGTAYIDQNRCIPWADQRDCIVCQEMCPLPDKAIVLDEVEVADEGGGKRPLKRPRVIRDKCIGCGICENRCPMAREAAIRVYALAGRSWERNFAG
jgi:formate hydrogenlyase subunit 6/NADH:ubiquinone oxidoreductase subunit I